MVFLHTAEEHYDGYFVIWLQYVSMSSLTFPSQIIWLLFALAQLFASPLFSCLCTPSLFPVLHIILWVCFRGEIKIWRSLSPCSLTENNRFRNIHEFGTFYSPVVQFTSTSWRHELCGRVKNHREFSFALKASKRCTFVRALILNMCHLIAVHVACTNVKAIL